MSRRQEFSYRLQGASHHTDKPESRHQKELSRQMELEQEALKRDEWVETHPHVDGFHEVMVESRYHHLKNVEACDRLLKLLNFHHGMTKGFSDGYSNI